MRIMGTAGVASAFIDLKVVVNPAASFEIVGLTAGRTGDVLRFKVRGLAIDGKDVFGYTPAWSVDSYGGLIEADGEDGVFVAEMPGTYTITAVVGPQNVLIHRSTPPAAGALS